MNSRNTFAARTAAHAAARATAFGFAAVMTLSILASVDRLATQPAADMQMARQTAPTQVVATEAARPSNI
ncbi:MAG TPA: hypothetical protein VLM87_08470 [Rubrivivax sp.]|nr:hypothetical protein [Rubrivivax sp.]